MEDGEMAIYFLNVAQNAAEEKQQKQIIVIILHLQMAGNTALAAMTQMKNTVMVPRQQ